MRFFPLLLVAIVSLAWVDGASAQTRAELARCRTIEDDVRRLACYDALASSPAAPLSKYEPVPLEELARYALSYRGRLVEVAGRLEPGERFFALRLESEAPESLPVDFRGLSRGEQQAIREQCGTACRAIVQGEVGPVNFTTGIVAEAVIVQ